MCRISFRANVWVIVYHFAVWQQPGNEIGTYVTARAVVSDMRCVVGLTWTLNQIE